MYRIATLESTTPATFYNIIPDCLMATSERNRLGLGAPSPFILRKIVLYTTAPTHVYINTSDADMAAGLNRTALRETFAGSGIYALAISVQEVLISKLVLEDMGISYEITFLF